MTTAPTRLMLLGNRRIAWEVLKLLSAPSYRSRFDIQSLVTDSSIWQHYQANWPDCKTHFISSERRQSEEIREAISAHSIDVILSIQYNWILPGDILDLVHRRAFNLHNARLPDYKGYNSISHAIANGDSWYESTVHWMTEEVDCGDLAYVSKTPIQSDDTAMSLYLRTVNAAVAAVRRLLDDLASGTAVPAKPTPPAAGTFFAKNSVGTLANVTDKLDTEALARVARAAFFPPHNAAYFLHEGRKYLLVPANEAANVLLDGKPINEPQF